MPKRSGKPAEEPQGDEEKLSTGRQIGVRFTKTDVAEIERIAKALGLEDSSLIRMIVKENLHIYRRRVEDIEKHAEK